MSIELKKRERELKEVACEVADFLQAHPCDLTVNESLAVLSAVGDAIQVSYDEYEKTQNATPGVIQ